MNDAIDERRLRAALGSFLTGVAVATARAENGEWRGMTVNSFSSVSLTPPLASVCVARGAGSAAAFARGAGFAVNILADDQRELAAAFAGRGGADKFSQGVWRDDPARGGPVLADAAAWLDCAGHAVLDGGDHLIIVGRVVDFSDSPRAPLGFFRGRFFAPQMDGELAAAPAAARVGAIIENDRGGVLLVPSAAGLSLPQAQRLDDGGLAVLLANFGVDARLEFIFAVYDDGDGGVRVFYRGETAVQTASGGAAFYAGDEIPWARIADAPQCEMLRRYLRERVGAQFGIYAGGPRRGAVRALA